MEGREIYKKSGYAKRERGRDVEVELAVQYFNSAIFAVRSGAQPGDIAKQRL